MPCGTKSPSRRAMLYLCSTLSEIGRKFATGDPVAPATREDLDHFPRGVDATVDDRPTTREERRQAVEHFLEGQRPKLPALLRRAYRDFQKP